MFQRPRAYRLYEENPGNALGKAFLGFRFSFIPDFAQ